MKTKNTVNTHPLKIKFELFVLIEKEAIGGLKFKIVETLRKSIKQEVQKSNTTRTPGYPFNNCLACKNGRGAYVSDQMSSMN